MAVFEDLMYPDNKNRALRASQLGQDCADFAAQSAADKEKISSALTGANDIIKSAYKSLAQSDTGFTQVPIDTDNWVFDVADTISPLVIGKAVTNSLYVASRAWLLRQGRLGEAAFADLIGLPAWMEVGKVMGGIAAAVAVEAIIESIEGAVQRDKLRQSIHSLVTPRVNLKRHAMINGQVLSALQSVIAAYQAISYIPGLTVNKEQLDAVAQNLIDQHTVNFDSYTDDAVRAELANYDRDRGAWTYEDN